MLAASTWELACVDWSARIAVFAYLVRLWFDARRAHWVAFGSEIASAETQQRFAKLARMAWTCGALFNAVHLGVAFGLIHDWSQLAAIEHTAEQTERVVGIRVGFGVFVNYVFTFYWIVDTVRWWAKGADWPYRSRARYWSTQVWFAFIVLNATVVFGPWWWTPLAAIASLALLLARIWPSRD